MGGGAVRLALLRVRFTSKADIVQPGVNVRFVPKAALVRFVSKYFLFDPPRHLPAS